MDRKALKRILKGLFLAGAAWMPGCDAISNVLNQGGQQPPPGTPADTMPDADWAALKSSAMASVRAAPGWGSPELVPGQVNSTGWEDSASISPDGQTLYFAYLPCDFHNLQAKANMDLSRFGSYKRGPERGNFPEFAFDTFAARRSGAGFGAPAKVWLSAKSDPPQQSETGFTEVDGLAFFNSNHPASPTDYDTDIWRAPMQGQGEKLAFNTSGEEHDPTILGGELLYWTQRGSKKAIMSTRSTGANQWSPPAALPEPINMSGSDSWQPHFGPDGILLFTSNRQGPLALYQSKRGQNGAWSPPERIVWIEGGGAALGVAEPSITADGREIYFCVLFRNPGGAHDLDIARITRR